MGGADTIKRWGCALVVLAVLVCGRPAAADPLEDVLLRGWTESDFDAVPALIRDDVRLALIEPTLVRHFPRYRVASDLHTENWLASYPPIAAAVGRELGVLPYVITESWPNIYVLTGGALSRGTLYVLQRTDSRAVMFATVRVRSPWRSAVRAYAVGCVRWWPAADGHAIEHDIFVYGRLRSRTARMLNFVTRPLSGPWITRRLRGMLTGMRDTAEAVSMEPELWAERMNERRDRGTAEHLAWEELLSLRQAG